MKNLILGAAAVALAAACGGGGKPQLLDASTDAQLVCNPVAQTGCMANEKCTWIVDIDGTATSNEIGHIGCAPTTAADLPDGSACTDAVAATNGGADTCVKGDLCIARKCKPICDPQVTGSTAAGACPTDFVCTTYAGVFDTSGVATAGVCEPSCDPLTQRLKIGTTNLDACGSADPTKPSATCIINRNVATLCAPSGPIVYNNTDRKPALTDPSSGRPYPNGCAPGFFPVFRSEVSGSMTVLCAGMCAPLKVDMDIAATPGHAMDNEGDVTVAAKLTTEAMPMPGNAVCVPGKKGTADLPQNSNFGEDCRFAWPLFAQGNPPVPAMTPYNNTLGFCFAYYKYIDVDVNGTNQPEKSCAELPATTPAPGTPLAPWGSADENGCYPLATAAAARKATVPRGAFGSLRAAYGDVPLVRHVFD